MSSKLIGFTALAVTAAVAVSIASLVLNIIILTKTNTVNTNTNAIQKTLKSNPTTSPTTNPTTSPTTNYMPACSTMGNVSTATGFSSAAAYLLSGLDPTVDPCTDFYAFSCNKYLASINLDALGLPRKGTYDDSQVLVNTAIAAALSNVNYKDTTVSVTERITKHALDSCVYANNNSMDYTNEIDAEIKSWFGGIPFAGGALNPTVDLFAIAGTIEQTHALPTIMASFSSVDYKNVKQNALYVSQPQLDMPLDYFVKPQYIDQLRSEQAMIFNVMQAYINATLVGGGGPSDDDLQKSAQDVVNFEVAIAMASWPDDLMRNYKQQYNPYNLASLQKAYPNIVWSSYLNKLLTAKDMPQTALDVAKDTVVLSQPSYFSWLDSVFLGNLVPKETIANYMIVQLLQDDGGFWGGNLKTLMKQKNYVPYNFRRGRGVRRLGRRHVRKFDDEPPAIGCLDMIMNYMPYGPGFVYVKNQTNRDNVVKDVTLQTELIISNFQGMMHTLDWLDAASYQNAINKSNSLIKNYGWPNTLFGDFKNTSTIDTYHQDYQIILNYTKSDFYYILKALKRGSEIREIARLLNANDNAVWGSLRANFLASPAEVNAWYQPERNSITFPYAAWNPPYYSIDFPQAYNYAGQGGTGGHGVQFDWDGSMTECDGKYKCGWMSDSANDGFTNMAQCVVSQYSSQCCPLKTGNVHCANGATTQGENIADLGGQQAAYLAYRQFIEKQGHEELRLPGLSSYTPNQIFWITYGYSWCMKQTDANMVKQLLTNPHAPAICRVNQVMEDIPQFGVDFNCPQGSTMYPTSDGRCKVWVGY